jgi:hypothetical protein
MSGKDLYEIMVCQSENLRGIGWRPEAARIVAGEDLQFG